MPQLDLPDVTLCCVDTRSVPQALDALGRCMTQARFGQVLFLGPPPDATQAQALNDINWVVIPPLKGIQDYNRIMLHGLAPHIRTSHVLIVQWDGFITHPTFWRSDFLAVDYIGAPWYHAGHPGMVGNGGFSLRSKRLIETLASLQDLDTTEPEDRVICVQRRAELEQAHGIRFASLEMAQDFSCEYGDYRPSFGFHGMHNFANIMLPDRLRTWLADAPAEIITSQHGRKLIKALIHNGDTDLAKELICARSQRMGWSKDQVALYLRAKWRQVTTAWQSP